MKITHVTSALLAGVALLTAWDASADVAYTVTQLTAGSPSNNGAYGLSSNGLVAGSANQIAFLYSGGKMTKLGAVPGAGSTSFGWSVNASGQVAGYGGSSPSTAALYSGGVWTKLGTLGGNSSSAIGINDAGLVVGYSQIATGYNRGFLYKNGTMLELAPLAGNTSTATAINNAGQIAGTTTYSASGATHAAIYTGTPGMGGAWTDIGSLGGSATANAINGAGEVVGSSTLASGMALHAFLYSGGTMHDLGALPGAFDGNSFANGINDSGVVVGYCPILNSDDHAFIYQNGAMRDLNDLIDPASGWVLNNARAINNAGQIVGYGTFGGTDHAFLLTPVVKSAPTVATKGKKRLVTTRARLVVRGTTSGEVTSVTCKLGKRTRVAQGTSAWKFIAALKPGRNVLTIIAHGPGEDSAPVKIVIVQH